MSEDQKAGTTKQDDADDAALAAAGGTPDEAGRDAGAGDDGEKRTDWKALYLSSKDKIERANQLERDKADLEERLRAAETSPTRAPQTDEDALARRAQERYMELLQRAQGGDVVAEMMLEQAQTDAVRQREWADELYLSRLPEAEAAELRKFHKANRQHFNSIAAAHDAMEGRKARQSRTELARKEKAAEEIIERKDADVVKTHQRDVSVTEVKQRKMTEAQFVSKLQELEAAGKTDEAMRLARQARRGEIVVA